MSTPILRLATRGSPLALAQAHLVRASLADAHGWDESELLAKTSVEQPVGSFRPA